MRIGIDLGGTKIAGIVMDAGNRTIAKRRVPTHAERGYPHIVTALTDLVFALEQEVGVTCQVGLGAPGSLSRSRGVIKNCNVACINGQPLKADIERRLERTIRVANDANCFTLSESRDGAARGFGVVFGVILGTGVGGGIAIDGRILSGANDIAGEWGHMPLTPLDKDCYCGRRGCVETALSGPGLLSLYHARGGLEAHDAKDVASRAKLGTDPIALAVIDDYLTHFARALSSVINVLDPHAIVLGGGLSHIDALYTEGAKRLAAQTFTDKPETVILPNKYGDASGVRGAAMLWAAHAASRGTHAVARAVGRMPQVALP